MIWKLLKNQTSYDIVNLKQTIGQQIEICFDKLVKKKIDSSTKNEKNDFKLAIEQFINGQ